MVLSKNINLYRDFAAVMLIFSTQLCELLPLSLLFSVSTQSPSPLPCMNNCTVYKYTVCKEAYGVGSEPQ